MADGRNTLRQGWGSYDLGAGQSQMVRQNLQYPEHRGLYNRIIPRWIEKNVRDLLPTKADTYRMFEKFGSVETGLSGWPVQFNVKYGFLEGFYRVKDLWAEFDNLDSNAIEMYDLVTGTPADPSTYPIPQRPEIEYMMHRRVFYDYAMFGMRFAFNEWDARRLGKGEFNRYMNEILSQRIDSYAMALNRALWEHWIGRPRTNSTPERPASYRRDGNDSFTGGEPQDLGSIPFFINGLGFRIGIRADDPSTSAVFPGLAEGETKTVFAVTYHDGSLKGKRVAASNQDIYFSGMPVYWFPDTPGLPIIRRSGGQIQTLLDPNLVDYRNTNSLLIHQTIGNMNRGYRLWTYQQPANSTNFDLFWGFNANGGEIAVSLGTSSSQAIQLESPVWDVPSPFYFSPSWKTFTHFDPQRIYDHSYWFRHLAVVRATKMATVYSERRADLGNEYPIYFGENGVASTGNPWAHQDYQGGADTRFTLTAQALERVWQYLNQNGSRGPKILACHPNVAIALNVYAMNNIDWQGVNKRSYGPVDFSAEFPRYRDAVVFTDMMIPDGVVYIINPNEGSMKFLFDEQSFRIDKQPTKNAIHLYGGFFLMKLAMLDACSHAIIWGVKPY